MKNVFSVSIIAIVLLLLAGACEEGEEVITEDGNTPYTLVFKHPTADTVDLIAGKEIDIGEVQIWHDMENLYVKYLVDEEGWCLDTTHLHVAESEDSIPQNSSGNPVPGQFDYITGHDCLKTFTDTLKNYAVTCNDSLVVAAHADVVKTNEDGEVIQEETAWGEGDRFTDPGNWATYFVIECIAEWPVSGTVSIAYEDLPVDKNDWDYNDLVIDIDVEAIFEGDPNNPDLAEVVFMVRPQTKTADYTHKMFLSSRDDFNCSGTYNLLRYEDEEVTDEKSGTFDGSLDVELIPNTGNYPDSVSLEVIFDDPENCSFTLYEWKDDQYHGESLFFDPYLKVNNTGEEIQIGDIRMLTVPIDWQWPPEDTPIWEVYPRIEKDEDGKPVFEPYWWEEYEEP